MTRCWLVLVIALGCSAARPSAPDPDAGDDSQGDAAVDGLTTDPDAGDPDAAPADAFVDTCPSPSAAFVTDLPPTAGSNTTRRRAALQVDDAGGVRVFTSDYYGNGSFYEATLVQHTRGATAWSSGAIANAGIGSSIARYFAATHGADPCIAYSNDYNGQLHLRCTSLGDRIVAPAISGALALARSGSTKHLVYEATSGTLVWQPYEDDPGTAEPIHQGAWSYGPSSVAVDGNGDVHVAYVVVAPPPSGSSTGTRTLHYAIRQAGTWTEHTVDTDTWSGSSEEASTVSLVLAGTAPVIAFHHRSTRSLRLARRSATSFDVTTLLAPDAGFDNDRVGSSVALSTDCAARLHVVYQRSITTDAQPNLGLAYAQITGADVLVEKTMLPMTASTAYKFASVAHGLAFTIDAEGRQYVAAQLNSIFGPAVYFASR